MSYLCYFHNHPSEIGGKDYESYALSPHPYDYGQNGLFEDRIYHSQNNLSRFYVVTFGFGRRWLDMQKVRTVARYTLHVVLEGECLLNGNLLEKGDVYAVLPNEPYTVTTVNGKPHELGWIALGGKYLEQELDIFHLTGGRLPHIPPDRLKSVREIFLDTVYTPHPNTDIPSLMFAKFFEIVAIGRLTQKPNSSLDSNRLLDMAEGYINDHYAEDLSVERIADFLHISTSYLRRLYDRTLGYSPMRSLIIKRMNVAKAILMTEKDWAISAVAAACGYSDQSSFSSRFKEETGLSPREFRQSNQAEGV